MVWIQPLLQEDPKGKWNSTYSMHRVTPPRYREIIKTVRMIAMIKNLAIWARAQETGQSQEWALPCALPALGNQLLRDFLSCRGLREGKRQPAGCSVSQGRDTKGWELQPQSTFTALQLLFGFLSPISAVQNIIDQGLQCSPCTKEPQKYWWWGWQGPVASQSPACFPTWHRTAFVHTKGFLGATMGVSKTYRKLKPSKC